MSSRKKAIRKTTTTSRNAALYVRVSGEYDERTASLDSQEEACRELVARNGFKVSHVLVERHTGRHLHQRVELSKLRKLVNDGEIQCVCFYQIDRLSRGGSAHIWILLNEFRTKGIELLSVHDDNLSDTPMNNMMLSVKAEFAAQELLNIKDRTQRGRRDKLKRGVLPGQGNELYGYRKNKETWKRDIHEAEAETVRLIFKLAIEGKSRRSISRNLDALGVPTPSQSLEVKRQSVRWQPNTITKIIRNPAYRGEDRALVWTVDKDGEQVRNDPSNIVSLPGVSPAIVDPETWALANEALSRTAADYTRNLTEFFILRGLVWCLKCEKKAYVMKRGSTRSIDLFRCSSICRMQPCGASTVSVSWLTHSVWSEIRKIIQEPETLRTMIAEMSDTESQKAVLQQDAERYGKRIVEIEGDTQRLIRALARQDDESIIDMIHRDIKTLADQRREIEGSLAELREMIAEVESVSLDVPSLIELHNQFMSGDENWSDEEKRDYLWRVGYRVYFDGRSFELRLRAGKRIAKFDESTALIARGDGGVEEETFNSKHSLRSLMTSGRRAMCL